ncbi:WS/DGAT/MGAT family O-acyltransferase [Rhodococcus yananensis]|uniref:WS/DGAT/MGAT family O-acyltransferase n=1 Tax=Rhodococcus yananensis TaxID=2879464 RepID=UPI001CF8C79A|nr:wax ester/triacylglycerol synthase family O-acyltransferase [Rhodococcus yananensis]
MQRLSGLDASFLYLETPEQPLNVCGLMILDPSTIPGGYDFADLRTELAARVDAIPQFRMKIADSPLNPDHPVWIDDAEFDLDRHLHRIAVPAPGTRTELSELCGHLAAQTLDRAKPLWEMWVIENLADGEVAVLAKMHHAGVDGVTAAVMVAQLCSLTPDAPRPEPVTSGAGGGSTLEIALSGVAGVVTRPWDLLRLVPSALGSVTTWVRRARRGAAMPAPFTAPRTRFNATLTSHRSIAWARLDLADVKAVAKEFDVKINDVVTALCAGALRHYLEQHDELPDSSLVGIVPVSVHDRSDRPGRNQVSAMFADLHTDVADPAERLRTLARANSVSKEHSSELGVTLLQDWSQLGTPALLATAMRAYARLHLADRHPAIHNIVISNVPGPPVPLYFLGARITAMYPLGPVFHGAALNVTVLSLDGKVDVGIVSCPDLAPDLWALADGFAPALDELLHAVPSMPHRTTGDDGDGDRG